MGKEYGSSSTVSSVFEASGTGSFFAVSGKGIEPRKESREITKAWSIQLEDTTMDSRNEMSDTSEDGDITSLLHTKILLIAVLIVCFITLASVIAICGCMIRRYCQNREHRTSMDVHQLTAVSKSTSITGLNAARGYNPTKVEKKDQESSPAIIAHNASDESISCEPNSDAAVHDPTGEPSTTTKLKPARPDIVNPMYEQKDNPLSSTPVISTSHCHEGEKVLCVDGVIGSMSPDLQNLTNTRMPSQHTCDETFALVSDQSMDIEEDPINLEETEEFTSTAAPVVMRAPLTHSVSWFVSLNGDKTGSIRHSITENSYQELNMKDYENCPPDQRNCKHLNSAKVRKDLECHPLYELDENDCAPCQPSLVTSNNILNNVPVCLGTDEKIPLIEKVQHSSSSEQRSTIEIYHRNLPIVVENQENHAIKSSGSLPQSVSLPDDSNTWKQREDRPVLFLGSGVK